MFNVAGVEVITTGILLATGINGVGLAVKLGELLALLVVVKLCLDKLEEILGKG